MYPQRLNATIGVDKLHAILCFRDGADGGDGGTNGGLHGVGDCFDVAGGDGEEEFVVFAAVERPGEGVEFGGGGYGAGGRGDGDFGDLHASADVAALAKVGEVAAEAIADIEHGGDDMGAEMGEHATLAHTRLRDTLVKACGLHSLRRIGQVRVRLDVEACGGSAEGTGDAERVAYMRACTSNDVAAFDGAEQRDIEDEQFACARTRDIAAHDGRRERFGFLAHAIVDLLQQVE